MRLQVEESESFDNRNYEQAQYTPCMFCITVALYERGLVTSVGGELTHY